MSNLNDQTIIDNTHFTEMEGKLVCYTNLPGGERFAEKVSSKEQVQKNMIGWCNTVREYVRQQERSKAKPKTDAPAPSQTLPETPDTSARSAIEPLDAKQLVIEHYENLREARVNLIQLIDEHKGDLLAVEKEIDELHPVIKAWRGVKGET